VPSIIYGLLGLGLFVRAMRMGPSVIAGASTLALLALPVVIISTREALRAVPKSLREGSYALGATKWQTIWYQVLPAAFPGMLTGIILALSRAIGETAPLVTIGALTYVPFLPQDIWSPFTVLPIQIFAWVSRQRSPSRRTPPPGSSSFVLLLAMNGGDRSRGQVPEGCQAVRRSPGFAGVRRSSTNDERSTTERERSAKNPERHA
jgi:phosphate transport system permease protein